MRIQENPEIHEFTGLVDMHVHLRQTEKEISTYAPFSAELNAAIMVMLNTNPPCITTKQIADYKALVTRLLGPKYDNNFKLYAAAYLSTKTDPNDLKLGFQEGMTLSGKLYPFHGTTGAGFAPRNWKDIIPVLEMMQEIGMVLCVHGEMPPNKQKAHIYDRQPDDRKISIFDSEKIFIEEQMYPLAEYFPHLKMSLEHISTKEAIGFVNAYRNRAQGTLTPQHLLCWTEDMIATNWTRVHKRCNPILKGLEHMEAIQNEVIAGNPNIVHITDSAPHPDLAKYSFNSCCGVFNAAEAHELAFGFFHYHGIADKYQDYAGTNAAKFYGIEVPRKKVQMVHIPEGYKVPDKYGEITPMTPGEILHWKGRVVHEQS